MGKGMNNTSVESVAQCTTSTTGQLKQKGLKLRVQINTTRFLVTGDLHVRDGPFPDDLAVGKQLIKDCFKLAKLHGCGAVIFNGDVWHQKNGVNPRVLLTVHNVISTCQSTTGIPCVWIRGNHESPWRSDPERTLMRLFSRLCHTVISPRVIQTQNHIIWLGPWYPGTLYKRYLKNITRKAFKEQRKKVLISHIGVKDGVVSPSNTRIHQEVGVDDFCPQLFDYILLGDYHAHQYLGDRQNMLYLGSPLALTFGDFNPAGPWLLDLSAGTKLSQLELPSIYPRYESYTIRNERELIIPVYKETDRNRIKCSFALSAQAKVMYPDAKIIKLEDGQKQLSAGRVANVDENDWKGIFQEYHALAGWDKTHMKIGLEYLKEAVDE